ncbi:MAG: toll/interleukin-1 receptor domain-containing protein, partial [Alistipes sp.]|nr:toll/interleukin-1 receptor domain-containing protein [Alistipes sp.]
MKYDVFISYSRQDQATADHLCKALDEAGVSYWIDRRIHGSANFLSEITRYIKQCQAMIFIASAHSAVSEFTQKEILFALKHHKTIIPYRIGKFRFENNDELDFVFTNVQWKEREEDVIASLDKLGLVPKKEPLPPPAPQPKRMNLKKVLWTVVVLLLFVGGIFGGRAIKNRVDELQFVRDSLKLVQLYQDSLVQAERAAFVQDSTDKANAAAEKAEKDRLAKEKAEKEKVEQERLAEEKAAQEQAEQERLAAEKAERERLAAEQAAKEKAEKERREREAREAAEKAERERLAREAANKTYKVGDYYNVNGKEGVVFYVDETGKHGKIVSMTQSSKRFQWSSNESEQKRLIGASSKTNGAANMRAVQQRPNWRADYPAFAWCARLGAAWYLPAIEELKLFTLNDSVHDA